MSQELNPILNGPYTEPRLFYRTLPDGTLDYTKKEKGRRPSDTAIYMPNPIKITIEAVSKQIRQPHKACAHVWAAF
jgi:hypothetical protein